MPAQPPSQGAGASQQGAGAPQLGSQAGAGASQQAGAGASQQAGAGSGQQTGAGPEQLLWHLRACRRANRPPWQRRLRPLHSAGPLHSAAPSQLEPPWQRPANRPPWQRTWLNKPPPQPWQPRPACTSVGFPITAMARTAKNRAIPPKIVRFMTIVLQYPT